MLIPVVEDYYAEGCLPRSAHRALIPFFPNVNLAVRRRVFDAIGPYDETLTAAEDADLCRRAAMAGFDLHYEPRARVRHACRPGFRALARQWVTYGYWSAAVHRKQRPRACEVFVSLEPVPRVHRYARLLGLRWFPVPVLVFLTYFSVILLGAALALALLVVGSPVAAAIAGAVLVGYGLGLILAHPVLRHLSTKDRLVFVTVTCVINLSCMAGSIVGGLRNRMLYVHSGV